MKGLRYQKILMRSSLMNSKVKYEIQHSAKNLVDLDTSSQSEDGDANHDNEMTHDPQENDNHSDPGNPTADPNAIMSNLTKNMFGKKRTRRSGGKNVMASFVSNKAGIEMSQKKKRVFRSKEEAAMTITVWAIGRLKRMYVLN